MVDASEIHTDRWVQEDKVKVNLDFIVNSGPAWAICDFLKKKEQKTPSYSLSLYPSQSVPSAQN